LAVQYPDGPRHDLGFDELLFTLVMTTILFRYARKPRPAGRIIGLFATMYAPVRFGLDFLRATDVARPDERYAGLTPAQWACMGAFAVGLWLLGRPSPLLDFTGPPPPSPPEAPLSHDSPRDGQSASPHQDGSASASAEEIRSS
jgi:phosphatidylglycerol:prolipoprotein diacylglycerol transferase